MEIRLIADGEQELCNEFYNRVHRKSRTMNQWRWEFTVNNYDGDPIPYAVVADGDKIVGTQAFIPIRMIDREGVFWTAKSEETLVDPDYRGQKLFEKMYALLFDYAKEHDFASIWGFTPAIKAFVRLGFDVPTETEQLFIPFSERSISTMMKKDTAGAKGGISSRIKTGLIRAAGLGAQTFSALKLLMNRNYKARGLEVKTMESPDDQCGDVCRRFIHKYGGITIFRDKDYLQWRLFDNPYVKSVVRAAYDGDKLVGWTSFTLGDDGLGYLVDLMVASDSADYSDEDVAKMLLMEAVIGTRNMGATGIRGWSVNEHTFDKLIKRVARRVGFYLIKRGHTMVIYDCEAGKRRESHERQDNWFVSRVFTEGILG